MPDWMALSLIVIAGFIPGWLSIRLLQGNQSSSADGLELAFVSLAAGLAGFGWLSVTLAEMGWFSIPLLAILWAATVTCLSLLCWKRGTKLLDSTHLGTKLSSAERLLLATWLAAAIWLFFRPHQFIIGAADAGVYVNLATNIARTGSIIIQDEGLSQLEPGLLPALLRPISNPVAPAYLLPGFYVIGEPVGEITPQFYPMHPVFQAVGIGLSGVQVALLLPGLWALLGSLAIYIIVRRFAGRYVAALALVGLSICALQVWFGRYPTTETLTQYLLWVGLWAAAVWLGEPRGSNLWPLSAGLTLGSTFLVRIDMVFVLPILLILILWLASRKQPGILWFSVPLLLLFAHSLLHGLWQSRPYFSDLLEFGLRSLPISVWGPILVVAIGLAGSAHYFQGTRRLLEYFQRPFRSAIIIILVGLAIFGWFVWPNTGVEASFADQFSGGTLPELNHENLIRLGWYLSPVGVGLGVLGVCLLVWRINRQTALMLAIGIFYSLFYLWRIRNNPTQIYAMRRYLPVVVPFFIIGAAYVLGTLASRSFPHSRIASSVPKWSQISISRLQVHAKLAGAVLLAGIWLVGITWSARGFVSQVDYVGLPDQLAEISASLAPNAILIFDDQSPISLGDVVGTPLRFLYGHDVYSLRRPDLLDNSLLVRSIEKWHNSGRTVYWIGEPDWLALQGLPFSERMVGLSSNRLEGSLHHRPAKIESVEWLLRVLELEPPAPPDS